MHVSEVPTEENYFFSSKLGKFSGGSIALAMLHSHFVSKASPALLETADVQVLLQVSLPGKDRQLLFFFILKP